MDLEVKKRDKFPKKIYRDYSLQKKKNSELVTKVRRILDVWNLKFSNPDKKKSSFNIFGVINEYFW